MREISKLSLYLSPCLLTKYATDNKLILYEDMRCHNATVTNKGHEADMEQEHPG